MQHKNGLYNKRPCTNEGCPEAGQNLSYYRIRQHQENFSKFGACQVVKPNQLEALEKKETRRAKVPYLRYGDGEMYLCDNEGCPKAGQPLSLNTNKNHRKNFKKYGACYKSL